MWLERWYWDSEFTRLMNIVLCQYGVWGRNLVKEAQAEFWNTSMFWRSFCCAGFCLPLDQFSAMSQLRLRDFWFQIGAAEHWGRVIWLPQSGGVSPSCVVVIEVWLVGNLGIIRLTLMLRKFEGGGRAKRLSWWASDSLNSISFRRDCEVRRSKQIQCQDRGCVRHNLDCDWEAQVQCTRSGIMFSEEFYYATILWLQGHPFQNIGCFLGLHIKILRCEAKWKMMWPTAPRTYKKLLV